MRRFRFSISSLLILVLFVGVGFGALREANDLWDSELFTLTLGVLLVSILLAVHRKEAKRAFWIGFAVFGWSYLGLSLVPPIKYRLLTTKALAYLDSKVPGRSLGLFTVRLTGIGTGASSNQIQNLAITVDGNQLAASNEGVVGIRDATTGKLWGRWIGTTENFIRIGHSLLALLVGWFGGQLSRRLWRASRSQEPPTADEREEKLRD
jgi:hypothetical protein